MLLYIHGFASSGRGAKALAIRRYFKKEAIAPSLSYIPDLAIDTLVSIIEHRLPNEPVGLIGSSLGGYFAIHLSERYDLPAVLINPSIKPYETLSHCMPKATNFYDLSSFEWNERHIEQLKRFDTKKIDHPENFLLMLQTADETLDYRIALEKLKGAETLVEEGGSHAFEGFEDHLDAIENFFVSKEILCKKTF